MPPRKTKEQGKRASQPSLSSFFFSATGQKSGFENAGNTCYIAASLSGLFAAEVMRDALRPTSAATGAISRELADLARDFSSRCMGIERGTIDPRTLKAAIDSRFGTFAGYKQQDAQEFTSALLAALADERTEYFNRSRGVAGSERVLADSPVLSNPSDCRVAERRVQERVQDISSLLRGSLRRKLCCQSCLHSRRCHRA